jgi:glycosyltransferase involved in cell wall biosynthesis
MDNCSAPLDPASSHLPSSHLPSSHLPSSHRSAQSDQRGPKGAAKGATDRQPLWQPLWRIAWLFPSLDLGSYWHPIFSRLSQRFVHTRIFTGRWPGFAPGFEDSFAVQVVGHSQFVATEPDTGKYVRNIGMVSPKIVGDLFKFKPDIIFASGFSLWTILSLLLKPIGRWRVVIVHEGSSQTYDFRDDAKRLALRRLLVRWADAYITNSATGKAYLTDILGAAADRVFARPYQVPDAAALRQRMAAIEAIAATQRPVFLFVGQLVPRKGLHLLIEACALLKAQGHQDYTLIVVGDGAQRAELEQLSQARGLTNLQWAGWVAYDQLGSYFTEADVFILPSQEDTWGMVVLEAMVFGKPILCSQWVGAMEMVHPGENGYIFDPNQIDDMADCMRKFIQAPDQIAPMGARSQQLIEPHNPPTVVDFLTEVTQFVLHHR